MTYRTEMIAAKCLVRRRLPVCVNCDGICIRLADLVADKVQAMGPIKTDFMRQAGSRVP